ncbi:MAG: AAA family ATPase [Propionibacteriaceae bacterium]|nr:AAA family ATPase [Propionibacteriaceae bacterium]
MRITRVGASNWRNFKNINVLVDSRLFIVGPNASGKSNLLDLFRFMGDLAASGGGLSSALDRRGGLSKVRSLFARNNAGGRLVVDFTLADGQDTRQYILSVKGAQGGKNQPIVHEEVVIKNGEEILRRPDANDVEDPERLTQTHLEQISANQSFRPLAEYFSKVRYVHLVPQVIRNPRWLAGASGEAHGSDFIAQMNATPQKTRDAWLRRMEKALKPVVPDFESLTIEVDATGQPHLIAGYRNWRERQAKQNEVDFSDGTLRLIGLLWTLVSAPANRGVLLLKEPELSLNAAIVRMLATMLAVAQRDATMQVLLSTHAPELLDDEGVLPREILVLRVTGDGSSAQLLSEIDEVADELAADLPKSDAVQSLVAPPELAFSLDCRTSQIL